MAFISAAVAIGTTAYGVSRANSAADDAAAAAGQDAIAAAELRAKQSKADDAGRLAVSRQLIAEVEIGNRKLEDLKRSEDIMITQAKADSLIKTEAFNRSMSIAMVKGAASGRVLGVGSLNAGFNKAHEDFAWESMWDNNILDQSLGAFARDRENVLESGVNTLKWGAENLELQRTGSSITLDNQASQAQSAFNQGMLQANNARTEANISMVQGLTSFGTSLYSYAKTK